MNDCSCRRRASMNPDVIFIFCTADFSGSGGMITPCVQQPCQRLNWQGQGNIPWCYAHTYT
eukprot:364515-Chlamydomonas_euryale.AAC.15